MWIGAPRRGVTHDTPEADPSPHRPLMRLTVGVACQAIWSYMDAALMASDIFISDIEVRLQSYIRPTWYRTSFCVAPMKSAEESLI